MWRWRGREWTWTTPPCVSTLPARCRPLPHLRGRSLGPHPATTQDQQDVFHERMTVSNPVGLGHLHLLLSCMLDQRVQQSDPW